MFKRLFTAIFLTVLSVTLLLSAALAYLIISPVGGKLLVKYFKQQFASVGLMTIGHYQGSLQEGFVLNNVNIKGIAGLPGAIVRVQEVRVHLPLWDLVHSHLAIFNARLIIPNSDPLVFTGDIYGDRIKGNLYGQSLDIHQVSLFYVSPEINRDLQGYLTDIDFDVSGSFSAGANLTGAFKEDRIQFRSILMTNGSATVNLTFSKILHDLKVKGVVIVNTGLINVRHTNLQLSPSTFNFNGDFTQPLLDIHLGASIEDTSVHLVIKGAVSSPQLIVTSDPPMPPQDALQMLFTGNAVSTATSPFNGVTSGELAQNFLNYSLADMDDPSQFGVKTRVAQNLKLGVEMDQLPGPPGATNVYYSRKINGEMDMTQHMSLNVSREVFSPDDRNPYVSSDDQSEDTQIYMQYKKRF